MNWTIVLTVGPILFAGPPIVAVILCETHAKRHGKQHAAAARIQVQAAEAHAAAKRAAARQKEPANR